MNAPKVNIKSSIKLKFLIINVILITFFATVYFSVADKMPHLVQVITLSVSALLIVLLNLFFLNSLLLKPMKKIIDETDYLGKGNLDHLLTLESLPVEFKPLAKNLNKMAETFKKDSDTLKTRINELTTIYKLNSEIAITLNVNQVMDTAKQVLKSIIDFSKILIYVIDSKSSNFHLASGINLDINDTLELGKDDELVQLAFTLNDAIVLNQFPEMMKQETGNENWVILSPMVVNQEQVGVIKIEIDEGKTVDEDIVRLIRTLTTQIGIGIQNSLLYGDLEQKVADQTLELRNSYEIIFSQKEELQKIIQSIGDPLVVTDGEHRIEMVNDAFIRAFDLKSHKTYLNTAITEVFKVPSITEFFYENIRENEGLFTKEITITQQDMPEIFSEEKYFMVSSALVIRENRKMRYVTILRDITEEKKLDKMKTDFVSTVSHELRTPLTSIKAFAKILLADPHSSPKDREEFLKIIDSEADRLTRLINDILDHAKLEAGKLEFEFVPLDIVNLMRQQIRSLYSLIQQAGVNISLKKNANIPLVVADRDRVTQVITNLISNASKFTEPGGKIDIVIKNITLNQLIHKGISPDEIKGRFPLIEETHSYVVISIADTGIGISKDNLPKVFDKFKQIGDTLTDKPQGTGLGLPICKQIMESHQGNIWVESEYGQGSNFYFSLPIYSKKSKNNHENHEEDLSKHILIIDADEAYLNSLMTRLSKYTTFVANTIEKAIELVEQNPIDLIILDHENIEVRPLFEVINRKRFSIPIILNSYLTGEELPYLQQRITKDPPEDALLLKRINHLFDTEKPKILLAISNETISYQLSVLLTQSNYDIFLARSAKEGLSKCFAVIPDMIVLSDMLTDIPLMDFFKELKNHEITNDIKSMLVVEQGDMKYDSVLGYDVEIIESHEGTEKIVAAINKYFLKFKEVEI